MFLFHWCLNAIRCRRETTLETTPLSPTKYNGLPLALDCGLQRQLAEDMPASSCDATGVSHSLLDETDRASFPSFFHDHLITVCPGVVDDGQESATSQSTCHSESRDSGSYFHPHNSDEAITPRTLSTLRTDDGTNGYRGCECENVSTAAENTGQVICSSCSSVPLFTDFHMSSSQLPKPHLQPELRREVNRSDNESSDVDWHMPRNSQIAGDIGFMGRNLSRSTNAYVLGMSHRNAVTLFPVDTVRDPLVTAATSLVNFAFNAAVKILHDDVTVTSEPNPLHEVDVLPVSSDSNSVEPLCASEESTKDLKDPVEAAASRLVGEILSEVVRKNSSSVFACTETVPGETALTTATCVAAPHSASSPSSCCEQTTADSNVQHGAITNAARVPVPTAAAEDNLPESDATGCAAVDEVLTVYELDRVPKDCDQVYSFGDDFESMASLYGDRPTFASEGWCPISPSTTDVSEVSNDNHVITGLFDVNDHLLVSDDLSRYDRLDHRDNDAQTGTMYSETIAERDLTLSGNRDADNPVKSFIDRWMPDHDNRPEIRPFSKPFASESIVEETWNSYESSYRPEDYFFHRYVIPVDQLEAGEAPSTIDIDLTSDVMPAQNDRDEQRSRMQLDLKVDEENGGTDVDADIEAVAAFCRAMFTPVETDADDDDRMVASDVSSPETLDVDGRCMRGGRPSGVRRCISLRTSPGTPHKKKSVRFADALGLDLECVRQIQSVDEPLPTITSDDDEGPRRRPLLAEASAAWRRSRPLVRRYLCACFQAPGSHPDFIERVRRSRVALESCEADDRALTISGVVRVANVAYRKTVAVRVTTDGWTTQTDVPSDYVPRSNDGTTDRFSFQIVLPRGTTDLGRRVEFAVYFTAFFDLDNRSETHWDNNDNRSETYWDNNFGANYCFECYAHDDGETATLHPEMDSDDSQFLAWSQFI